MIKLCCSKKAEIGMTMTLVVATIIIVFLLGILFVGTVAWLLKKTPNTEIESANSVHQKRMMQNQLMVFLNTEVEFDGERISRLDLILLYLEKKENGDLEGLEEIWYKLHDDFEETFLEYQETKGLCYAFLVLEEPELEFFVHSSIRADEQSVMESGAEFKVIFNDQEINLLLYAGRC